MNLSNKYTLTIAAVACAALVWVFLGGSALWVLVALGVAATAFWIVPWAMRCTGVQRWVTIIALLVIALVLAGFVYLSLLGQNMGL
jgi:ABC-type microcin C transport system permease subunit YejB